MRPALSIDSHTLHFVVLPNYLPGGTLENLGRSPETEKHKRIVLDDGGLRGSEHSRQSQAFHGGDWPPPRGRDGHLSSTWCFWKRRLARSFNTQWAFRQLWKKYGEEFHQRDLSRVFITVGDADTRWHLQFIQVPAFDRRQCHGYAVEECVEPIPPRTRMSSLSCCRCRTLFARIITSTLEWAVHAGHHLSIVTPEHHGSEIGGVRTRVFRRGIRPEVGRTGACFSKF